MNVARDAAETLLSMDGDMTMRVQGRCHAFSRQVPHKGLPR